MIEAFQIIRPQFELRTECLEPLRFAFHLLPCAHITGRYVTAMRAQKFNERYIAHADAKHRNAFALDAFYIFVQGQSYHLA